VDRLEHELLNIDEWVDRRAGGRTGFHRCRSSSATLEEHLGAGSPLMRKLDPAAGDGLFRELDETVTSVLDAQRERILSEFSLDNRDGALARLVAELTERNGAVGKDLGNRVKEVAAELSLDDDDFALSRLVRRMEAAQARINDELTLDEEGSAPARLRREILGVLDEQRKNAETFHADVRATLDAVAARREEAARSTTHGHAFEDAVWSFVDRRSQEAGDVPARTGSTPGRIPRCKVGDAVIELGPEHAAAGARIVIEAKERKGVDLGKAREEMATARRNRDAGVGIFVVSARTAPEGMAPLRRYGDDVVLVWDSEDPASDVVLAAGLEVAQAISVQARAQSDGADLDLEELDRAILAIEKELAGLKAIQTSARTVTRSGDKILGHCEALRAGRSHGGAQDAAGRRRPHPRLPRGLVPRIPEPEGGKARPMKFPKGVLPRNGDKILIPPQDAEDEVRIVTLVRLLHEAPGGDVDQELWEARSEGGVTGRIVVPFGR
jgi:hypothetical protein